MSSVNVPAVSRGVRLIRCAIIAVCILITIAFLRFVPAGPGWVRPAGWTFAMEVLSASAAMPLVAAFLTASVLACMAMGLRILGWQRLLQGLGSPAGLREAAHTWLVAHAVGFFFPGSSGVDVARVVPGRPGTRALLAATVAVDRMAGLFALALTALPYGAAVYLSLGETPAKMRSGVVLMLLGFMVGGCLTLLYRPAVLQTVMTPPPMPARFRRWGIECAAGIHELAAAPARLAGVVLLAVVSNLLLVLAMGILILPWSRAIVGTLLAAPALAQPLIFNYTPVRGILSANVLEAFTTLPGSAAALGTSALGLWWLCRVLPALLGSVLYALFGVPRLTLSMPTTDLALPNLEMIREQRRAWVVALAAGAGGGLLAGACVGIAESAWMYLRWMSHEPELRSFWWGALVYGLCFSAAGAGVGFVVWIAGVAVGRLRRAGGVLALSFGSMAGASLLIIGRFRFARDVLGDHPLSQAQILELLLAAAVCTLVLERVLSGITRFAPSSFLRGLALVLACFLAAVGGSAAFATRAAVPLANAPYTPRQGFHAPNVFFIVVDTLRADRLTCYNPDSPVKTPHLDAFAGDAIRFAKSFSQAPWTKPSFGTLFTGHYPSEHGAIGKADALPPSAVTLAETLRDAGYYTQGLPNNRNLLPAYGLHQGFLGYDFLIPNLYFGATFSAEQLAIYQVLRRVRILAISPRIDVEHFYWPAPAVVGRIEGWLNDPPCPADAPFFLYSHFMDPHDPYMFAPDRRYGVSSIVLGVNPDPRRWLNDIVRAYQDEVAFVDEALGNLFADLKRRGLYDDALIVVTADHGEELQEHGGWSHGPTLFDEVTHVPIIIKLPGNAGAGTVNPYLARHIDLMPTILARTGQPVLPGLPGIVLVDAQGNALNAGTTESFAETNFLEQVSQSVRTDDAKFILTNPGNPRGFAPRLFFDLKTDPAEQDGTTTLESQSATVLERTLNKHLHAVGAAHP